MVTLGAECVASSACQSFLAEAYPNGIKNLNLNLNRSPVLVTSLKGASTSLKFGMNLERYWTNPKNLFTPSLSLGAGISDTALILSESG